MKHLPRFIPRAMILLFALLIAWVLVSYHPVSMKQAIIQLDSVYTSNTLAP